MNTQLGLFDTEMRNAARVIREELDRFARVGVPLRVMTRELRRMYIEAAVKHCNGSKSRGAELIGAHRNTASRAIARKKQPVSVPALREQKSGVA